MHIKNYTSSLLELIRYANKDKSLELEARVKSTQHNQINSEVFFNVMKRLKGTPGMTLTSEITDLDIGLSGDYNNVRVSVNGDHNITDYCKKNEIKLLQPGAVSFMKKKPIMRPPHLWIQTRCFIRVGWFIHRFRYAEFSRHII